MLETITEIAVSKVIPSTGGCQGSLKASTAAHIEQNCTPQILPWDCSLIEAWQNLT